MSDLLQFFSQNLFTTFVGVSGVLSASILTASALFGYVSSFIAARNKLRATEEAAFREILESDDILKLGDYLFTRLGNFTVREYASQAKIRIRVDSILGKLTEYTAESTDLPIDRRLDLVARPRPEALTDDFSKIAMEFETGEIWNGLARLRRIIEMRLRELGVELGFKGRHLNSAGQILRLLRDRQYLSAPAADLLARALRTCNDGIHGYPVELTKAQEALYFAIEGLQLADRKEPNEK